MVVVGPAVVVVVVVEVVVVGAAVVVVVVGPAVVVVVGPPVVVVVGAAVVVVVAGAAVVVPASRSSRTTILAPAANAVSSSACEDASTRNPSIRGRSRYAGTVRSEDLALEVVQPLGEPLVSAVEHQRHGFTLPIGPRMRRDWAHFTRSRMRSIFPSIRSSRFPTSSCRVST